MREIIIGSRESVLAVAQTKILQDHIEKNCPGISVRILTMKTTGDRILEKRLDEIGGKGLFVKELDLALLENRSQLSVHSLKDMPMETDAALPILGFSRREDPRDALVLPAGRMEPDPVLPIGTSSLRREIQLKTLYPEIKTEIVRGNVVSRLKKLDEGKYGALVLAAAGLKRLGLSERISRYFSVEEMLPAAGQGILAVQGRRDLDYRFLEGFFDEEARDAALAERAFVRALGGGCSSPVAAYAACEGDELVLTGLYVREDSGSCGAGTREADVLCRRKDFGADQKDASGSRRTTFGSAEDGGCTGYTVESIRGKRTDGERLGAELARHMQSRDCP